MKEILDFKYKEKGLNNLNNKNHSHNNSYEILFVYSGQGVVIINNKLYPLKKNTIYLINGIKTHSFVPKHDIPYVRSRIIIDTTYIDLISSYMKCDKIISDLFVKDMICCIELDDIQSVIINAEFSKMKKELETNDMYSRANITMSFFKLIILSHANKSLKIATIEDNISKILTYINDRIYQKISLDELSQYMHFNKHYLCHWFKKETNITINEYIALQRLSNAKKLLLYTDISISDIALKSGFSSFSYFSKIFKEKENISPYQFRKKYKIKKGKSDINSLTDKLEFEN